MVRLDGMNSKFFAMVDNERLSGSKISVLLGNGFSISIHGNFDYPSLASLLQDANLTICNKFNIDISRLLTVCRTHDFEKALQALLLSKEIITLYPGIDEYDITDLIGSDANSLRGALASAVEYVHPDRRGLISETQYAYCRNKLEGFQNIFTTNYDLLLEWVLFSRINNKRQSKAKHDGFRYFYRATREMQHYKDDALPFIRAGTLGNQSLFAKNGPRMQSVFYLHGALHLFRLEGGELVKLKGRRDDNDILLIRYLEKITEEGSLPFIVAEADGGSKLEIINQHAYLRDCYDAMLSLTGKLFIYNHKTYEHDEHIADAIVRSKIDTVVFGYRHHNRTKSKRQQVEGRINEWAERREAIKRKYSLPALRVVFADTSGESFWN